MAKDEMFGWHQRPKGHECEQALGDSEGQGSLLCCSPWRSQRVGHGLTTEQQQYQLLVVLDFHPELSLLEATYFSLLSFIFNPPPCVFESIKKVIMIGMYLLPF